MIVVWCYINNINNRSGIISWSDMSILYSLSYMLQENMKTVGLIKVAYLSSI